ncbi:MAG TPA: HAMP domain-containing sensor histidine kinase [Vicinamibacterales bacterium]|nr:HAMP domain-containing sensor histidine kinase [Vicinamibacterales bacterium]
MLDSREVVGRMLWVSLALCTLVLTLAALQYRWLGQVSDAERDRMRAGVRARASQIAEAFDREVTRAYVAIQVDPNTFQRKDWSRYAARVDTWRRSAAFPGIVGEILFAERRADGSVVQMRFDESTKTFEPAQWPQRAEPLRRWLAEGGQWPRPIWPDVRALVQPVADVHLFPDALKVDRIAGRFAKACVAALIDDDYVRNEVLPALVRRYVGSAQGVEYDAVVRGRATGELVYASDPSRAGSREPADVTVGLLDLRLNLLADFDLMHEQTPRPGEDRQFAISIVQRGPLHGRRDGPSLPGIGPFWDLSLRHRSGSLEGVVAAARRRNLLLSSGILALLVASVGLVVLSARRAERLAAQQVEFVAAVSHELRTPLAVIRSAGENLADGVVETPAEVQKYGGLVRDEGQRLTDLVEQVLAYAGIQSARSLSATGRSSCAVADIVSRAVDGVRGLLERAGARIDVDVPHDLPPVLANPSALERAVANLITNAVKYGGDAKWVGVSGQAASGEVRITVADRGIGIAARDLPHIFEPFYRSASVVAAQIRGTGLGLALVDGLVRAQGGRVTVESTMGQGSAFTIHLPVATANVTAPTSTRIADSTEPLNRA